MQNTELRHRARPVLDALRTLALQGRTPVFLQRFTLKFTNVCLFT